MSETPLFSTFKSYIEQEQSVTLATVVRGPDALLGAKALIPANGPLLGPLLDTLWRDKLIRDAQLLMREHSSATRRYEDDSIEVFFDVNRPPSR
ncbi:MAG: XdhC family protein, partial [Anaerolineae bacterium]|nr:XdhC family protein [Anaerolineae bacterium]